MKEMFGDEYPAAIHQDGVRMPLVRENRWIRHYAAEDRKIWVEISRFMDGSAAITFEEFAQEWPGWDISERRDFCMACSFLKGQQDFPDILRYIMEHGDSNGWSAVASSVGTCLPEEEALELLERALKATELPSSANLAQGISLTKHPRAVPVLRAHLDRLWADSSLWDDDPFLNWIAYSVTCGVENLIEAGVGPEEFTDRVRALSEHACARNRESCRRRFGEYFPWLGEERA